MPRFDSSPEQAGRFIGAKVQNSFAQETKLTSGVKEESYTVLLGIGSDETKQTKLEMDHFCLEEMSVPPENVLSLLKSWIDRLPNLPKGIQTLEKTPDHRKSTECSKFRLCGCN